MFIVNIHFLWTNDNDYKIYVKFIFYVYTLIFLLFQHKMNI